MNTERRKVRDRELEQYEAEQALRAQRRRRRRKRQRAMSILVMVLVLVLLGTAGFLVFGRGSNLVSEIADMNIADRIVALISGGDKTGGSAGKEPETEAVQTTESTTEKQTESETEKNDAKVQQLVTQADALAATYDYSGAIKLLKASDDYEQNTELQKKVSEYKALKDACVAIKPEEVTHIFYHSLVVDPSKAFDPDKAGYDGWQQWMTTVTEFDKITQSMYDKGYVLVGIHDLVKITKNEDGSVSVEPKNIYLPEGKKAYVLSLDDLNYYHTYDDRGVASKIVLDSNGKPTCEYIEEDGTVVTGPYDVVPRLDAFMEEHPDGCYRGARGIIALTGYNGVLGYRTDGTYSEENNTNTEVYYTDDLQREWLSEHPDFDWNKEREDCKAVIEAMKKDGWEFASHTWGHKAVGDAPYDELVRDTERWLEYVGSLTGEVDTIIFAHGQDISATGHYDDSNEKYAYLKSKGFNIFCNVDSGAYTTTVDASYLHQGRRNLDGYRIYQDMVSGNPLAADLFDASEVIDPERPLPVPDL